MKNHEKFMIIRSILGSVCLAVAGLILLLHADLGSVAVAWAVGWVLLAASGIYLLVCILSWSVLALPEVLIGAAGVILGIYILCNPLALAVLFGILIGGYLMVQALSTLWEAVLLRRSGANWLSHLVLAVFMLIVSIVLIASPLTSSRVLMFLCGLAMLACGTGNLILWARAARQLRKTGKKSNIIDADP